LKTFISTEQQQILLTPNLVPIFEIESLKNSKIHPSNEWKKSFVLIKVKVQIPKRFNISSRFWIWHFHKCFKYWCFSIWESNLNNFSIYSSTIVKELCWRIYFALNFSILEWK
jgi:hypothetical protein